MLARVFCCAVIGLEGVIVEVEVDSGEPEARSEFAQHEHVRVAAAGQFHPSAGDQPDSLGRLVLQQGLRLRDERAIIVDENFQSSSCTSFGQAR